MNERLPMYTGVYNISVFDQDVNDSCTSHTRIRGHPSRRSGVTVVSPRAD